MRLGCKIQLGRDMQTEIMRMISNHRPVYEHLRGLLPAALILLTAFMLMCMCGCALPGREAARDFTTQPIVDDTLEGLILEGEGPIPARLIYGSRNAISSEKDQLVLEAIIQELDKLVELAGRLDEAIMDETSMTDTMAP